MQRIDETIHGGGGGGGDGTPYDTVPYVSEARAASSIDRLAALSRLAGLAHADPAGCRVLELGCGDGGNLIPMAVSFPASTFFGIDLSPAAIERAGNAVSELGLSNVAVATGTFAGVPSGWGSFDYVIAHGVYSWVPAEAREELLAVIRARMAPQGVAFVSYNALPGSQLRGVLREMMRMHTRNAAGPAAKIAQSRALLGLLAQVSNEPGPAADLYGPLLQSDIGRALMTSDQLLYHDDLAEVSDPFFFSDFMDAAHRHGLEFVSEANYHLMSTESLPVEIGHSLADLGRQDLIAKEQYLDFFTARAFRQTILCHQEAALDRRVTPERIAAFRFSTRAVRIKEADSRSGLVEFRHPNKSVIETAEPTAIAALIALQTARPRSLSFADVAAACGAEPVPAGTLAELLFRTFAAGLIDFHVSEPPSVFELSERPAASPWARYRASTGRVANLYHELITLDEADRPVLERLDGEHTIVEIADELDRPEAEIRATVQDLANHGLLVG